MTRRFLRSSRASRQARHEMSAAKSHCAIWGLALLFVSSCGGGGGGSSPPQALTAQFLYCFGSSSTDALGPNGALLQASDGNFYGTSTGGGIGGGPEVMDDAIYPGNGTVFKVTPTGTESVLHAFAGPPADGAGPNILIQGSDGNFYGIGGSTFFRLTPAGIETILSTSIGATALLQGSDGNFYGTGYSTTSPDGMVFKLTPEGVLTTLYTFAGSPSDGAQPKSLLQGSDGNFYGLTTLGGAVRDSLGTTYGTVFKVTPDGVETILHFFSGPPADGWNPAALVQGNDGNLYGTTIQGGENGSIDGGWGTAFKLTLDGVETIVHSFSGQSDGAYPGAGLLQGTDGNFYGTTDSVLQNGVQGTIFELTPSGVVTGLYSFPAFPGPGPPSSSLVQGSDGNLYGATYDGGTGVDQAGCFYRFTLR
jgi:uncharacterized repeat protein (TIGR03803 family)